MAMPWSKRVEYGFPLVAPLEPKKRGHRRAERADTFTSSACLKHKCTECYSNKCNCACHQIKGDDS